MNPITGTFRPAPVLGIIAPMGAGKSSFLKGLQTAARTLRVKIIPSPMAGPLKDIARHMGWNGEKDEPGRRLLQMLGTDCGRECIGQDLWVNTWAASAHALVLRHRWDPSMQLPLIVADDIRFQNEAMLFDRLGGHLVRIDRPGYTFSPDGHASETGFEWPCKDPLHGNRQTMKEQVVVNDGSVEDLHEKAGVWLRDFLDVQWKMLGVALRDSFEPTLTACINGPRCQIQYPLTDEEKKAQAQQAAKPPPHARPH